MSRKQVTISEASFTCPATGKTCRVGVALKFRPDDIMQMPLGDYPPEKAGDDSDG